MVTKYFGVDPRRNDKSGTPVFGFRQYALQRATVSLVFKTALRKVTLTLRLQAMTMDVNRNEDDVRFLTAVNRIPSDTD
jgi:hypothetical protein